MAFSVLLNFTNLVIIRKHKSFRYCDFTWQIKTDNLQCHQLSERGAPRRTCSHIPDHTMHKIPNEKPPKGPSTDDWIKQK